MKLTKKPAVKLSDNTPVAYLLSSLCNCTVCECQELALNKAPVLLTTPKSMLPLSAKSLKILTYFILLVKTCSGYRIARLATCPPPETNLLRILY